MQVNGAEGSGEVSKVSRPRNRTESIEGGMDLTSGKEKKVTSMRREVVNAGLRLLYLNECSIQNKVNELVALIEIGRYNVVGITEMWPQGDQGWDLNIQGYVSYWKDRQMGKGGGVALLVRN